MSTQISTQTISFNNQALITFEQNGTHYTAMKPICENIGLTWHAQYERIKRDEILSQGILIISELILVSLFYYNNFKGLFNQFPFYFRNYIHFSETQILIRL